MMKQTMQMEYGMLNSRSVDQLLSADGSVSVFQKSFSLIFSMNNSFQG